MEFFSLVLWIIIEIFLYFFYIIFCSFFTFSFDFMIVYIFFLFYFLITYFYGWGWTIIPYIFFLFLSGGGSIPALFLSFAIIYAGINLRNGTEKLKQRLNNIFFLALIPSIFSSCFFPFFSSKELFFIGSPSIPFLLSGLGEIIPNNLARLEYLLARKLDLFFIPICIYELLSGFFWFIFMPNQDSSILDHVSSWEPVIFVILLFGAFVFFILKSIFLSIIFFQASLFFFVFTAFLGEIRFTKFTFSNRHWGFYRAMLMIISTFPQSIIFFFIYEIVFRLSKK